MKDEKIRKRILIVSPHPDDETFSMGGTILKLKKTHEIHLLTLSFGEKSMHPVHGEEELRKLRKKELLQASRKLGISSVRFAGLPDTGINSDDAYRVIKEAIRKTNPHRIYIPSNPDRHQDHLNAAKGGILAALHEDVKEILCYDSFSSAEKPDYYEDISDFLEKKLRICGIFKTQVPKRFFDLEKVKAKSLVRGLEINTHAAEGFKVIRLIN